MKQEIQMSRSLKVRQHALSGLEDFIARLRLQGETFLPSERKLCEELNFSRETVRRALEILETRQVIIKEASRRIIVAQEIAQFNVAFVAAGWGAISNSAWARLWHAFSFLAAANGINAELVLFNWDDSPSAVREQISEQYDAVVFSAAPNREMHDEILALQEFMPVICTDEVEIKSAKYVVSLDNYAGGRLAAQQLLVNGYSRPAALSHQNNSGLPYFPFEERLRGFNDALREAGISVENNYTEVCPRMSLNKDSNYYKQLEQCSEQIAQAGFDSLFVFFDSGIEVVYKAVSRHRTVGEDFGLVTMNGCNECRQHKPVISSVSHATYGVARGLVTLLDEMKLGTEFPEGTVRKSNPNFHYGETLKGCRIKTRVSHVYEDPVTLAFTAAMS
jgi:DNA-binding LacI/PurR family transcriptional regulator